MAVFHLSTKIFSRKNGDNAVMKAAYRAGERLFDERTGEPHDYSHRRGVEHAEVVMPTGSIWAPNRSELWNAVERKNKRADSQVAREFEVSLPTELDADRRRKLAIAFTREIANRYGITTDVAIHAPSHAGDKRNHHAHILTSTNKVDGLGFGNKARELDLVAHNMSGKLGQSNEIEWLRARWAEMVNLALAECAVAVRVDHRSYERQALATGHDVKLANLPTVHLGPQASALERRGIATVPGDLNRKVKIFNLEAKRVRHAIREEARQSDAPAPATPLRERKSPNRKDQLRTQLRDVLGLAGIPSAAEASDVIRKRRDELLAIPSQRLSQSEAYTAASLRVHMAIKEMKTLGQRWDELQARGRKLQAQANQNAAATQWRRAHPMRAWLHDMGVLTLPVPAIAGSQDELRQAWEQARKEDEHVRLRLEAAQREQREASWLQEQLRTKTRQEANPEVRELATRLDQAELLAADLQRIEEAEQQKQTQKQEALPITRKPDTDRDDEPRRRPTP